jgi:hypothetical protein
MNQQRCIPRAALLSTEQSPWRTVLDSRNDQALITLTGFDFETFEWLCAKFYPIYSTHSPFLGEGGRIKKIPETSKGGRPRLVSAADCLGLCLAWTRTRGSTMVLQLIFGVTSSNVSIYLRFGRRILVAVLESEPLARLSIPSDERIKECKRMIEKRHPLLKDVWCCMDGLKLQIQKPPEDLKQGEFYNGWTHDHYVTSVFVFAPDGTIPICSFNHPGSTHDSDIAEYGGIYKKLGDVFRRNGGRCVADQAFSGKKFEFVLKSSQSAAPLLWQNEDQGNREVVAHQVAVNIEATSMRQSAEWGMRAFQSSFPRVKDRIIYETRGERRLILKSLIFLFNVRARKVGVSQIKNTYVTAWDVDANERYGVLNGIPIPH